MNTIRVSGFADEISPDFHQQLAALNEFGVSHIELRGVDKENISDLSPQKLREVKADLAAAGISVSSIGSPIGKISIEEDFAPHLDKLKRTLEIQKELGAPYLRMFSFYIPKGRGAEEFRGPVLERMSAMAEEAGRWQAVLLHENEKGIYGDTAPRCLDLMEQLAGPNLQAVFDFANFVEVDQDTLEAFSMMKPYIAYVHIKDAVGLGAPKKTIVPAGQGDGHVEKILGELIGGGWRGYLSLEPHLTDFSGLAALEQDPTKRGSVMDGKTAWSTALAALRDILGRIAPGLEER